VTQHKDETPAETTKHTCQQWTNSSKMIWSLFAVCGVLLTWIGRGVMGEVERARTEAAAAGVIATRAETVAQVHAEQIRQIREIVLRIENKLDRVNGWSARTMLLEPPQPPPK
jgi:hypothetical protein